VLKSKEFILDQITPIKIYSKLKKQFGGEISLLFESAESGEYSFILIGAKEQLEYKNNQTVFTSEDGKREEIDENPIEFLKNYYSKIDKNYYKEKNQEFEVGFIDGFIGYIGYDAIDIFEPRMKPYIAKLVNEIDIPDIHLIRPKMIVAYSHKKSTVTLISSEISMVKKFDEVEKHLKSSSGYLELKKTISKNSGKLRYSKEKFFKMIKESKKMIRSGDVFQILISNRFTQDFKEIDPFSFYRVLRSKNPSPYMFYMDYNDFQIIGSSPEVMVKLTDGEILLRPIAGTRKRGKNLKRDKELENEMLNDPKEKAEHLMLIDLGRNDVGRVAKKGTVRVPNMFRVFLQLYLHQYLEH